jgi:hypothetical protein
MSNKLLTLAFNCSHFRGTDRLVLLAIADRINEETWSCSCGYEDLMRRCHCVRSVLAEALSELKKSGVLLVRRRFSDSTVYGLDADLLAKWQYAPRSTKPERMRKPNRSDSGEREFGSPNANPAEPNSPPAPAEGRGAGTESLRSVSERSEDSGSPTAIANAMGTADNPASQETNLGGDPRTPRPDACNVPVQEQGTASPRDPALTGNTPGETPVPPKGNDSDFPNKETEPARTLAWELWCFVSGRPEVEVPFNWEKLWTKDFERALNQGYSYDAIQLAIRASQTGAARPMYVRALSIVNQIERLIDNGQKLEKGGYLTVRMCPHCKVWLTDFHFVDHVFEECPNELEIDPEDALEEQLQYMSEDLHDEGILPYGPEGDGLFYPWPPDDHNEATGIYPWGDDEEHAVCTESASAQIHDENKRDRQ